MYQDTITLFNRKPGDRGNPDAWYPTVIENVNLNVDRAAILAKYGPESQDKAVLFVRYTTDGENILVSGKPWALPKAWPGTEDSLTFGTDGDFFWQGEWDGGIVTDEQYGSEGFYGYMNRTHDNVFSVTSVAKYSVIPHFEIMGK
jgi:hypothetical protein